MSLTRFAAITYNSNDNCFYFYAVDAPDAEKALELVELDEHGDVRDDVQHAEVMELAAFLDTVKECFTANPPDFTSLPGVVCTDCGGEQPTDHAGEPETCGTCAGTGRVEKGSTS